MVDQSNGVITGGVARSRERGQMNKRVTFVRRQETGRNTLNEPTFEWVTLGQSFAMVEDRGTERIETTGSEGGVSSVRLVIRDTPFARSLTTADRVTMSDATQLTIVGLMPHPYNPSRFVVLCGASDQT